MSAPYSQDLQSLHLIIEVLCVYVYVVMYSTCNSEEVLPMWMAETGPIEMPVRSRNFNRSVSTRTLHAIKNAPFDPMEQSCRSSEVRVDTFARAVQSCRQLGSSNRRDRSCRLSRETFKARPLNIGIYIEAKKESQVQSMHILMNQGTGSIRIG